MMPEPKVRMPLWHDGHGIERLPLQVTVAGEPVDVCVVRSGDLLALEELLAECRNVLALIDPRGIDWSDDKDRERLFGQAGELFDRTAGVLRGDEECFEPDDQTEGRPV